MFRIEGEIQNFPNKQKLKMLITTKQWKNSVTSIGTLLNFYLLGSFHCIHPFFSCLVNIFMTIILNSLSAKLLTCFINICFWSFILFFRLENILMFLHFAWLCVSIWPIYQTWEMFSSISSVMEWDHMAKEDDNGAVIYCTNICYEIRNTISSK